MLLLVLAGNFLLLIVGWAFVGAASYLLISFWYRRTTATRAGIKAFVINVVGDVGLVLGTYFIFKHTGTLDFLKTFKAVDAHAFGRNGDADLAAGCLLLLVGAFAKSAQIPLHTWLPDAMEGPTPVSALIHAATMVTAGVYLIARMHPLFELAPAAQDVGAAIGALTLLIAGTIALAQTDIKRVIAYSTMSPDRLHDHGRVASARTPPAMFHLMTHAFFKALLFMGAGSVIGAMGGEQSMEKMGGFRKALPFTLRLLHRRWPRARPGSRRSRASSRRTRSCSSPVSRAAGTGRCTSLGYVGAFMTAIYTFRMIFRAFHGEPSPRRASSKQGHIAPCGLPTNPANGEERGHRRRLPRPLAPDRGAHAADEGRDERRSRSGRSAPASCRSRRSTT